MQRARVVFYGGPGEVRTLYGLGAFVSGVPREIELSDDGAPLVAMGYEVEPMTPATPAEEDNDG